VVKARQKVDKKRLLLRAAVKNTKTLFIKKVTSLSLSRAKNETQELRERDLGVDKNHF
jgi:hypothetical protein